MENTFRKTDPMLFLRREIETAYENQGYQGAAALSNRLDQQTAEYLLAQMRQGQAREASA